MLIVHSGHRIDDPGQDPRRFPAAHADDVRSRLEQLFAATGPSRLVTAAAAGADLLAIAAARSCGVPVTVALPLLREEFRLRSVDDQGAPWTERYQEALSGADQIVETDLSGHDDWYLAGNDHILDVAAAAADKDPVLVVAVRAGAGSATDDLVERAAARAWPSIDLDPSIGPERRPLVLLDESPVGDPALAAALIDLDLDWALTGPPSDARTIASGETITRLEQRRAELDALPAFAG